MRTRFTISVGFLLAGLVVNCSQNRGSREIASNSRREATAPPDWRQPVPTPSPIAKPAVTPPPATKPISAPPASNPGVQSQPAPPEAALAAVPVSGTGPTVSPPATSVVSTHATVAAPRPALRYAIELLAAEGGEGRRVPLGHVFRSGDRIRIQLSSVQNGYVTVLQVGNSGSGSLLYPDPGRGMTDNLLSAGMQRFVPPGGSWFRFDQQPGEERLLVVFSGEQNAGPHSESLAQLSAEATQTIIAQADGLASKGLRLETVSDAAGEDWIHVEGIPGQPLVFSISLRHE